MSAAGDGRSLSGSASNERWEDFKASMPIGREVIGTVKVICPFGIFVDLGSEFLGLIDVGHSHFGSGVRLPKDPKCWPTRGSKIECYVNYFRDHDQQVGLGWKTEVTMDESEWLSSADPEPMLDFWAEKVSDRKRRLFACACCRRSGQMMADSRNRIGVDVTEKYADGLASNEELAGATEADVWAPVVFAAKANAKLAAWFAARGEAADALGIPEKDASWTQAKVDTWTKARLAAFSAQADLLRDIFGNPFRPISLDQTWLTLKVKALVQGIYDNRSFDRLPALADVLEVAGCTNEAILSHCRGPGPHVRGCWVLDAVLGKE
jgi:hypothetical protein